MKKDAFVRYGGSGFILDGKFYSLTEGKAYLVEHYGITEEEAFRYIKGLFHAREV